MEKTRRKLAAIFSADVNGYSRLMADDEEETVRMINTYRGVMIGLIREHNGRPVDAKGDNVLAEFPSVVDAVQCAVEVQENIKTRNSDLPDHRKMEFRIGVNLGDVIEEEGTIYGDGVNVAARLEGLAEAGGICVSGTAFDHLKKRVPVGYAYLGKQSVKNIPDRIRVYKILFEKEASGRVIGKNRKSRFWMASAAAITLTAALGGLFGWLYHDRRAIDHELASPDRMAFPLPDRPSLAVLPFDNLSEADNDAYIADGLTENIIAALSNIAEMFVIGRTSTFIYKNKALKIQQVSEELGVRHILVGSVQKSGDNLRITAQLIDATTGSYLWAERYDRKLKDLFRLQDEITLKIISALSVKLTEGERAAISRNTENLEAWRYCVKGVGLFEHFSMEDNTQAREYFEKAVSIDPEYAFAWAMLAWVHVIDAWFGFSGPRSESINKAEELAKTAAALGGDQAELHSLWSTIHLNRREYDKAITEGRKAIAYGPNNALSHVLVAYVMLFAGEFDEAVLFAEKAIRLTPYCPDWYLTILGQSYRQTGRLTEAFAAFNKALDRSKENMSNPTGALLGLVDVSIQLGRDEQARRYAAEVMGINPGFSFKYFHQVYPYKNAAHLEKILVSLRKAGLK